MNRSQSEIQPEDEEEYSNEEYSNEEYMMIKRRRKLKAKRATPPL
jgi:hypothetical protein